MRSTDCVPFLLLASLTLASPSAASAQSKHPDLAGVWVLNPTESDSTETLDAAADKPMPRPPGTGGVILRGRGGLPVGLGGGFGRPRGFDPELMRQAIAAVHDPAQRMVIAFNADTLLISTDGAAPWSIRVNGKKSMRPWIDGEMVEIKASWKDDQLRIERKLDNELEITETYSLDRETGCLVVISEVDGPIPREIELKRVYDRARGG